MGNLHKAATGTAIARILSQTDVKRFVPLKLDEVMVVQYVTKQCWPYWGSKSKN